MINLNLVFDKTPNQQVIEQTIATLPQDLKKHIVGWNLNPDPLGREETMLEIGFHSSGDDANLIGSSIAKPFGAILGFITWDGFAGCIAQQVDIA